MQQSYNNINTKYDLFFASSNTHKYEEANRILESFGISLGFFKPEIDEIQSDDIKHIARKKSEASFKLCKKPVIIEDDGLFIDFLSGFPGPYSSYVFGTIGNSGILRLLSGSTKRNAKFQAVIAYCDSKESEIFSSKVHGTISKETRGTGWGYDPIFVPRNYSKTFAQLEQKKDKLSHRYKALCKFAKWYLSH